VWQINGSNVKGFPPTIAFNGTGPGESDLSSLRLVHVSVDSAASGWRKTSFMLSPEVDGSYRPYYSQFGLAADVLLLVKNFTKCDTDKLFKHAKTTLRALTATVLGLFVAWAFIALSKLSGCILGIFFCLADGIILNANNAYWVLPLSMTIFVMPWVTLYIAGFNRRGITYLIMQQFIFVFLRGLFGYEYLSCFVLAPLPALFYYAVIYFDGDWRIAFKKMVIPAIALVAGGVLGFSFAVGAHLAKGYHGDKITPIEMMGIIKERAVARVGSSPDGASQQMFKDMSQQSAVYGFLDRIGMGGKHAAGAFLYARAWYFYLQAYTISIGERLHIPFAAFLIATLSSGLYFFLTSFHRKWPVEIYALFAAVLLAVVVSFSWAVAAPNHMMHHAKLNLIIFHFSFMPIALLFMVETLRISVKRTVDL